MESIPRRGAERTGAVRLRRGGGGGGGGGGACVALAARGWWYYVSASAAASSSHAQSTGARSRVTLGSSAHAAR